MTDTDASAAWWDLLWLLVAPVTLALFMTLLLACAVWGAAVTLWETVTGYA